MRAKAVFGKGVQLSIWEWENEPKFMSSQECMQVFQSSLVFCKMSS